MKKSHLPSRLAMEKAPLPFNDSQAKARRYAECCRWRPLRQPSEPGGVRIAVEAGGDAGYAGQRSSPRSSKLPQSG